MHKLFKISNSSVIAVVATVLFVLTGKAFSATSQHIATPNQPGRESTLAVPVQASAKMDIPQPKYDLYSDEAQAVLRYVADPSKSNLDEVARIRFLHAATMANLFEKNGGEKLFEKALDYAVSATELSPHNAFYQFLPGYLFSLAAKDKPYYSAMAEEYCKTALAIDPGYMEARALLANLFLWRNSFDNALNEYEKLVQDYPGYIRPDTINCMCHAYRQDGQQVRGEQFFRQLTNRHPNSPTVKLALAALLKDRGKTLESRKVLLAMKGDGQLSTRDRELVNVCLQAWYQEGERP